MVISAFAFASGWYVKSLAKEHLVSNAEKTSSAVVRGYINSVWIPNLESFGALDSARLSQWQNDLGFLAFSKQTFTFFEKVPNLVKVNLYSNDGKQFLSNSDVGVIFEDKGQSLLNQANASPGNSLMASDIIVDAKAVEAINGFKEGILLRSVIPVSINNETQGFVELLYNVSDDWASLSVYQYLVSGFIMILFLFQVASHTITARKSEAIITRKHEENIELESARNRAEAESRQKSQFLANVSHELRTPLNAIIGFSEIMKGQGFGPLGSQEYVQYVTDINNSGQHLLALINDILDYSKAEAGKLDMEIQEVDTYKLFKSCVRFLMPRAELSNVIIREEFGEDHIVIETDARRLKQILLNLLSNSVKFTPEGGSVALRSRIAVDGRSLMIEVEDTGIGMDPKDISKAMSAFGQIDNELSRKYEGTGLGLPLTRKLVELLGGTFNISSQIGKGTRITVILPLKFKTAD